MGKLFGLNIFPDKAMLEDSNMVVIDIRTAPEWEQTGIVPGSHCITFFDEFGQYDAEGFMKAVDELGGKEALIGLICRTGTRTHQVAMFMFQQGYKNVKNLDGGVMKLLSEGYRLQPYQ
jgi:rhodanese-related sulfurtransferase